MSDPDSIVGETVRRIFADLADPQMLNAARDTRWKVPLWSALEDAGLTLAWVAEARGGAGAGIVDGFEILRIAGQHAAPVAIAETLLGGWMLDAAGIRCPAGQITVAPIRLGDTLALDDEGTVTGAARAVPFLRYARAVVAVADREGEQFVALMSPETLTATDRPTDLGGERCDISFRNVYPVEIAPFPAGWHADTPMLLGAAVRAAQMAGALETVLALSVRHASDRIAFGRPIAAFQAIQHNLARLAGEVAAALAASGSAADALGAAAGFGPAEFLEIAAAKIRTGEAVNTGAPIAHQVHGAIGWTAEHVLQRYTRRMWGWRDDFGSESHWAAMLGDMVVEAGAEALWPMLAAR